MQFAIYLRILLVLLAVLWLPGGISANQGKRTPAATDEPPVIGQPEHFSGAVGLFRIATEAWPSEVQAGDSVFFRVRITSRGLARQPPPRPNLRNLKSFKNRFVIQDLPAFDLAGSFPGGQAWDYHYFLKPRSLEVHDIPPLLFVYYKPGVVPREKGYWTTASPAIPLSVRPRGKALLVDSQGNPIRAPQALYALVAGPTVLRHVEAFDLPRPWVLCLMAVVPPLLALGWYRSWRRRHPDATRQAQLRRSEAAQHALALLRSAAGIDVDEQARRSAAAVMGYLQDRTGALDVGAWTELLSWAKRAGVADDLSSRLAEFFLACEAARFAPHHSSGSIEPLAEAEKLIHALESALVTENGPSISAKAAQSGWSLLVMLLAALPAQAGDRVDSADLLRAAEESFRAGVQAAGTRDERGHFRTAALRYEKLRLQGADNPELYLNEGRAWLLAEDLPRAILAFRRGLRLAPGHAALQNSLAYARSQVVRATSDDFGRPPVDHWPPGLPRPSARLQLFVGFALYTFACLALARWWMRSRRRWLAAAFVFLLMAGVVAASVGIESRLNRMDHAHPPVVLAVDDVMLRKGNGLSYPPRHDMPLHRGTEARLVRQRGDWLQIELPAGEIGWLHEADALVDRDTD